MDTHVEFFTTPNELRRIADKMESDFAERNWGYSNVVESIFSHQELVLEICANMDLYNTFTRSFTDK